MAGKILIVDAVATNRIVLKVRLTSAYFEVEQASSSADALAAVRTARPDMVIIGAAIQGDGIADLIGALRARPGMAVVPMVALLPHDSAEGRVAALRAGADDVIAQPLDERIMLARLRGLLRQHHALQDMRLNAGTGSATDCATGFAEAQAGSLRAGRITLLAPKISDAMALRTRLRSVCRHQITALRAEGPVAGAPAAPAADVFVLMIPDAADDAGLNLMAELRAAPEARHSRILALVPEGCSALAASLLDMGANDALIGTGGLDELALRLGRQIQRKHAIDHLRARLHDGLRAAMIDPLTGLYNRRFAMPFLKELAMAQGPQQHGQDRGFAVMVADLDHFKQINDRLGHGAGDRVLCHVADLLAAEMREGDMVARIGGEEFLIIMPGADGNMARSAAERICRRIAGTRIALRAEAEVAQVTISIGVAIGQCGQPAAEAAGAVETLLDQADRALYRAKARGRNTAAFSARPAA